jgi:hypothetical protein
MWEFYMLYQVVHILITVFQKVNDIVVKDRTIRVVMPYRLCLMWVHLFNELYFSEPFSFVPNRYQLTNSPKFIYHCDIAQDA